MDKTKQDDLRVRKTKEAIRRTFEEMICEMDYEQITVRELTDRAMINRKTFYLHYETLDNLLEELQQEIVDSFTSQNISYKSMADIKRIIRYFYEYAVKMPKLHERLLCSGSYEHIGDKINERIMAYQAERYRGAFSRNIYEDNLVFAYGGGYVLSAIRLSGYKQSPGVLAPTDLNISVVMTGGIDVVNI